MVRGEDFFLNFGCPGISNFFLAQIEAVPLFRTGLRPCWDPEPSTRLKFLRSRYGLPGTYRQRKQLFLPALSA
jgi:hypothetical protein